MNRRTLLRALAAMPIAIFAAPLLPKYATGGVISAPIGSADRYVCFENLGKKRRRSTWRKKNYIVARYPLGSRPKDPDAVYMSDYMPRKYISW